MTMIGRGSVILNFGPGAGQFPYLMSTFTIRRIMHEKQAKGLNHFSPSGSLLAKFKIA